MSRFKKTPRQIMADLCESAFWSWYITDCGKRGLPKPGEFYERRTTVEEKEILKDLKSEDLANFRPYPL